MPPRTALRLTLAFALVGAVALVPLLGLFGVPPAPPGTRQTWLAIIAMISLITAAVFSSDCGSAPVMQRPAQRRWARRLLDYIVIWLPCCFIFLPILHDATIGGPLPGWMDWGDKVMAVLKQLPVELAMAAPLLIISAALRRYPRDRRQPL